jgi:hypothetical protein
MNDKERDRLIAELIARPREREQILRAAELNDIEREDICALSDTADLLWLAAHGAPPLADDPVAAMLGLIPDRECSLDSRALTNARKRVRLTVSDLAERLRERGWEFQQRDVFRWETRSAADVAPAVVQAIADILGQPVDSLIAAPHSMVEDQLAHIRRLPLFKQLVDRWARIQHVSRAVAAASLETRMITTVHRGEPPDPEQLLQFLEALVTSIEEADEEW